MQASMPMYDWPELREATDAWWAALGDAFRAEGIANVPERLTRDVALDSLWASPELMFSQTCGYPLTHAWAGRLQPVATPHYAAEGCEGPDYRSFVLVGRDAGVDELEQLCGLTAAYNGPDSQSGYSALRAVVAPLSRDGGFFGRTVQSGSHLASMEMVAGGQADVCAADAVVWAIVCGHRHDLRDRLKVIARSPSAPSLPYVTSPSRSPEEVDAMRAALASVFADPALCHIRETLMLDGYTVLGKSDYDRVLEMEQASVRRGYAALA